MGGDVGWRGADPETTNPDGAGILVQMPDRFLRKAAKAAGIDLPAAGRYGAGLVFLPQDDRDREVVKDLIRRIAEEEGATVLGWRDVPTNHADVGASAVAVEPVFAQV